MRSVCTAVLVLVTLIAAPSALGAIRLISITSPVHRGSPVTLTIQTLSASACSIRVHYRSKPALVAPGLYRKGPLLTFIRWSWTVPRRAQRGTWSADVSCGPAGSLHTTFVVR